MALARPRGFEEGDVLDKAMRVFTAHGYEGASMASLSAAMGLTAPSIYAAFDSKRGLFEAVIDRHVMCQSEHRAKILSAPTAREVARNWLREVADHLLLIQGGLSAGPDNKDVPSALARRRQANALALWDRFDRAKAAGDLPADADPERLAAFITTVHDGMVVRAVSGATLEELQGIADQAMLGWPQ